MKKAIIIIVCVLVILGGVFASLFFFTDVLNFMKPANTNFALQAKKLLGTEKESSYSDYEKFLNNLKSSTGSKTANLDISMNMNLPTSVLDKSTQKTISSSKLNLSTSYDADKKTTSAIAKLKYNNKDSISIEAVAKDQSVSIKSSDIYDKYLTFDLSKYEEFCKKNQKISVNGEDIKTTAYSLTLTGEDGYDFLTKFIELIKNDSTLKSLIVSKFDILKKYSNSIAEATGETSSDLSDLSESDIEKYLDEILKSLKDSKDDFSNIEKCLRLTIYSKKDNPVKFEVSILNDKKDDDGSIIFTEELADGKNIYTLDIEKIAKVMGATSNTSSYARSSTDISTIASTYSKLIITDEYEASDDSRKGTATISVKPSGSSKQDLMTIEYDFINSSSEFKSNLSVSLSSSLASMASLAGVSGLDKAKLDYTYHVTGLNSDKQDIKFSINGNLSSYSINLDISGTISNKADIPEISSSNSVDVLSMTLEELQPIYTDVINSAADKLPAKLSDFGFKITKADILQLLPNNTQTPTQEVTPDTQSTTQEMIDTTNPVVTEEPAA